MSLQYVKVNEALRKILHFFKTGQFSVSRKSLKEVERQEREDAEAAAKEAADEEAAARARQGQRGRYREGSFDADEAASKDKSSATAPTALGSVGRMDRT